mmetsp:Transcript_38192/g.95586  ORF Transcript_38192/g.95586 Transcript_38192/m.95586 type:complete len:317 (-) Transcript_38192:509-1459(-)
MHFSRLRAIPSLRVLRVDEEVVPLVWSAQPGVPGTPPCEEPPVGCDRGAVHLSHCACVKLLALKAVDELGCRKIPRAVVVHRYLDVTLEVNVEPLLPRKRLDRPVVNHLVGPHVELGLGVVLAHSTSPVPQQPPAVDLATLGYRKIVVGPSSDVNDVQRGHRRNLYGVGDKLVEWVLGVTLEENLLLEVRRLRHPNPRKGRVADPPLDKDGVFRHLVGVQLLLALDAIFGRYSLVKPLGPAAMRRRVAHTQQAVPCQSPAEYDGWLLVGSMQRPRRVRSSKHLSHWHSAKRSDLLGGQDMVRVGILSALFVRRLEG